ncbi:TPA: hypothetical protein VB967_002309 [Streptococcus suis]|uniref:Uncharacterized protein n=2 Tax=Streptococcus suis TaxID=1307 RepID=A0A116NG12_STRSU|nr:hypothetical protein [Streptococcus suis]MCE6986871.1 hypothetical protein [Streptococcus suis]NQG70254.1 hypothetical protein [Streptococcus suis]NQJ02901.1 hypothetical protein [Streptococcus suis]NQO28202.1 hypothetical protein [Streptococcus suis]CYW00667.1 Uncharacterised protein [Streptococcus suis]
MTEAILTLGIFAVPILTVAVVEQRKTEKERKVREIARILEEEKQKNFRLGMDYRDKCIKQRVLNTERQQVDKEWERYAQIAN